MIGKWGYLVAINFLYLFFCICPQVFSYASNEKLVADAAEVPLVIATAMTSLQLTSAIRSIETKLRGFLHTLAQIPSSVLRLIHQLQGAGFNFPLFKDRIMATPQLRTTFSDHLLAELFEHDLIKQDGVLRPWFRTGCILNVLANGGGRRATHFDPRFVHQYKDELGNVQARHMAFSAAVSQHANTVLENRNHIDSELEKDVSELRDRIYAYLVCALHSSELSRINATQALREDFGFRLTEHQSRPFPLSDVLMWSAVVVIIAAFVTTTATTLFNEWLNATKIDPMPLGIPQHPAELFFMSIKTAMLYFAAILIALWHRSSAIYKRRWNTFRKLPSKRPIARYALPMVLGMLVGYFVLTSIFFLFELPDLAKLFSEDTAFFLKQSIERLALAMKRALPWVPLPMMVAAIVLFLSDGDLRHSSIRKLVRHAALAAAPIGVMGFIVMRWLVTAEPRKGFQTEGAVNYVQALDIWCVLIGSFIFLFNFMLFLVVQWMERRNQLNQNLCEELNGLPVYAHSSRGRSFALIFSEEENKELVRLYLPVEEALAITSPPPERAVGICYQSPEGTVIVWDEAVGNGSLNFGNFQIITTTNNSLILEGYTDHNIQNSRPAHAVHLSTNFEQA